MFTSRIINHKKATFLFVADVRLLSQITYEHGPITKIKKQRDDTKYRIPLLNNNEQRMWAATRGDQWNLGPRKGGRNYEKLATMFEVYPELDVLPFQNFNKGKISFMNANKRRHFRDKSTITNHYSAFNIYSDRTRYNKNPNLSETRKILQGITSEEDEIKTQDYLTGRGVTGTSLIGKSFGPPLMLNNNIAKYDERFESRLLQLDFRSKMTPMGGLKVFRVTVAVGNGKGMLGIGITLNPKMDEALKEAKQYAYQQLVHFPIQEDGSIPYSTRGRYHRTELHALPNRYGENKGQRVIKMLLDLAGYKGVAVKMFGRNTPEHIVKAFFITFQNFESPKEQAENLGRYVVQFNPKRSFHPNVIAIPSHASASDPVPYTAEVGATTSSQSDYLAQNYSFIKDTISMSIKRTKY